MYQRLGDRVTRWITHNEALITIAFGHLFGALAPGIRDARVASRALHHLMLSHGLAVQALRAALPTAEVGITNANSSFEAVDDREESLAALELARDFNTRTYHDPVYGRGYPKSVLRWYESQGAALPIEDGDLEIIAEPTDFLGVNLYSRQRVEADPTRSVGYRNAARRRCRSSTWATRRRRSRSATSCAGSPRSTTGRRSTSPRTASATVRRKWTA